MENYIKIWKIIKWGSSDIAWHYNTIGYRVIYSLFNETQKTPKFLWNFLRSINERSHKDFPLKINHNFTITWNFSRDRKWIIFKFHYYLFPFETIWRKVWNNSPDFRSILVHISLYKLKINKIVLFLFMQL
jgi:hypothetical protein